MTIVVDTFFLVQYIRRGKKVQLNIIIGIHASKGKKKKRDSFVLICFYRIKKKLLKDR